MAIAVYQPSSETDQSRCIQREFDTTVAATIKDLLGLLEEGSYKSLVVDFSNTIEPSFLSLLESISGHCSLDDLPLIILSANDSLQFKLRAYELGCNDYIGPEVSCDETCARINKAIFHCIANEQLKGRLVEANSAAYAAMLDNSDLGLNQRFLLDVGSCANLDQLGVLLFSTLESYGLSCSLHMRSLYGTKNMEANGMARDLESQLLAQMTEAGRYIDFGRRTIVNYGLCSLLIRNMPVDDERKYGALKDNTFVLVQGIHARIIAIDEHQRLEAEKKALQKLSKDVKEVMAAIDESYQGVMRDIVSCVEDMADSISERIPVLALSLDQEHFFETVTLDCVSNTNEIFNQGLKVDECFTKLSEDMDKALENFATVERIGSQKIDNECIDEHGDGIELF